MKKYIFKYSFEFLVIFLGILISLYFEQSRQDRVERERKNNSIGQLIKVIDQDIIQIDQFIKLQEKSLMSCNLLYHNLRGDNFLSRDTIIYHISSVGRALKSFFPQEGIFNQLISTGTFELIEKKELKSLLLKIYNHQNSRNKAISNQIDLFTIEFENKIFKNFRIDFKNNNLEGYIYGKTTVENYDFNQKFYYSNEFFGLLSRAKQWGYQYTRLLNDIKKNYNQAKIYALNEIK